jgi:DNA polymerase-3 subunit epsilon
MIACVFDCETTGLPDYDAPIDAPRQPYLVELAAELVRLTPDPNDCELLDVFADIVTLPPGVDVPDEAAKIHGISTQDCLFDGLDARVVLLKWQNLVQRADLIVAHNLAFDAFIVRTSYARQKMTVPAWINERQRVCTMLAATRVMKKPFATGGGQRFVSLAESFEFFCGEPLVRGHEAIVDVRATRRLLIELTRRGELNLTGRKDASASKAP